MITNRRKVGQVKSNLSFWQGTCSEDVKWYVRKTRTQLSKRQIAAFMAVYAHNNRPVQALNERTVYLDANPTLVIR